MKKISTKIVLSIILCTAIASALIGGISLFKTRESLSKDAKSNILNMSNSQANYLSQNYVKIESIASDLVNSSSSLVNLNKLKTDPNYIN